MAKRLPHSLLQLQLPPAPTLGRGGRLVLTLSLSGFAYLLGFALFVITLPTPFITLPPGLQGLAAFTGGAGRVETLLDLVEQGFPGPILISGSHPNTRLTDILQRTNTSLNAAQKQSVVFESAATTQQNLLSLRAWAGYHQLQRVGVITSTYHAPRIILLHWLQGWRHPNAPALQLTLLPVQPANAGLRPLFHEYNKLLIAPLLP